MSNLIFIDQVSLYPFKAEVSLEHNRAAVGTIFRVEDNIFGSVSSEAEKSDISLCNKFYYLPESVHPETLLPTDYFDSFQEVVNSVAGDFSVYFTKIMFISSIAPIQSHCINRKSLYKSHVLDHHMDGTLLIHINNNYLVYNFGKGSIRGITSKPERCFIEDDIKRCLSFPYPIRCSKSKTKSVST